jgi:hypothetical protein
MKCLKNTKHTKTSEVCQDCLKEINNPLVFPDLNQIEPELRGLVTQLTLQNTDFTKCWRTSHAGITLDGKKWPISNVLYAFFKADVGSAALKNICRRPDCVNPAHLLSRFEKPQIVKKVRSGFNRKLKDVNALSDAEWLRQP